VAGFAAQQLANDPGGNRWLRLVDQAVEVYADHLLEPAKVQKVKTAKK
jgi:hypothetical protein